MLMPEPFTKVVHSRIVWSSQLPVSEFKMERSTEQSREGFAWILRLPTHPGAASEFAKLEESRAEVSHKQRR